MKQIIILFLALSIHYSNAQSNHELVKKTLQNYIVGSSYNKLDLLESAFSEEATLYLNGRDGFKTYSPKEYIGFFKNSKPGKFNGRYGEILEINVSDDIATAKAEILIPQRQWRYIDLFLLRKFQDGWKIISKTATRQDSNETGDKILFVVSNVDFYPSTQIPTGNSFDEIIIAHKEFTRAGLNIDFVSPKGGAVPLAYLNTSDALQKKSLYNSELMYALKHTKTPDQIHASDYKAIYYVGGGSAMFDTPINKPIQNLAISIYENQNGIVGAVCHGTAGIAFLKTSDGKYLVEGKRVNGFPEDHENKTKAYFKTFPFLIRETIEEHGGKFYFSEPRDTHVEVDGRLVTGQNPSSVKRLTEEIIKLINLNAKS